MASLSIRIDLAELGRIGPGKVRLLEAVDATGSISAGGRELGMSHRRAWTLISHLNTMFRSPMVQVSIGGKQGGGAALTEQGRELVTVYREIEDRCRKACEDALRRIDALNA